MSRYILSPHTQGTEEWLLDRCGKVTGSRASDMLAKTVKGDWSAKRADYKFELAIEVLTKTPQTSDFMSREMQWGVENEPFARIAYEESTGNIAVESGFMYLPGVDAGCSVDGLFVENGVTGVLEIKSPKSTTHIKYMEGGVVPALYKPQCLHNIWVTGASFADFVSFDPRFPEALQLFIVRYRPTPEELAEHEKSVMDFLAERDELVSHLLKNIPAATQKH